MATTTIVHRWFWVAVGSVIAWHQEEQRAPAYVAQCRAVFFGLDG